MPSLLDDEERDQRAQQKAVLDGEGKVHRLPPHPGPREWDGSLDVATMGCVLLFGCFAWGLIVGAVAMRLLGG